MDTLTSLTSGVAIAALIIALFGLAQIAILVTFRVMAHPPARRG